MQYNGWNCTTLDYIFKSFSHDEQARSSKSSDSWEQANGESSGENTNYEDHLMKELGETKKAVQEIRDALMIQHKSKSKKVFFMVLSMKYKFGPAILRATIHYLCLV